MAKITKGQALMERAEEMTDSIVNGNMNYNVTELLGCRSKAASLYLAVTIALNLTERHEPGLAASFAHAFFNEAR
jgi:hypothetical protein